MSMRDKVIEWSDEAFKVADGLCHRELTEKADIVERQNGKFECNSRRFPQVLGSGKSGDIFIYAIDVDQYGNVAFGG